MSNSARYVVYEVPGIYKHAINGDLENKTLTVKGVNL
jgi:HSP20 family molecular chaperone IbpA